MVQLIRVRPRKVEAVVVLPVGAMGRAKDGVVDESEGSPQTATDQARAMPNLYTEPMSLFAWALVIGAFLRWMVGRLVHDCIHIRRYRQALVARARGLRFGAMVESLGINMARLLRQAGDVEFECRLITCEQCRAMRECDCYLRREAGHEPPAFCPNYRKLVPYRGGHALPT